jgi:sirohydrochlorin cobaltochelatase
MSTTSQKRGIVLFAHGSRDPLWHKSMEAVARRIQELHADAQVLCAYLELSTPDLPTAVATLVERGIGAITIVPMFLGVGKHAREDLPQLVAQLKQAHSDVQFSLQPAVGENPRLISLLADIALDKN